MAIAKHFFSKGSVLLLVGIRMLARCCLYENLFSIVFSLNPWLNLFHKDRMLRSDKIFSVSLNLLLFTRADSLMKFLVACNFRALCHLILNTSLITKLISSLEYNFVKINKLT